MKNLFKKLLSLLLLNSALPALPEELTIANMFDSAEDEHFEAIQQYRQQTRANGCPSAQDVLNNIVPPDGLIDVPAILQENFYKHTNPPQIRPILSLPSLTYPVYNDDNCVSVRLPFFYNQTHKMYFTKNSPFIKSYIDLENPNIVQQLNKIELPQINIPMVLPLFHEIKLQERRLGLALGLSAKKNRFRVDVDMPIYYQEHNFYLTPSEQKAIKDAALFSQPDPDTGDSFQGDNLVSSKTSSSKSSSSSSSKENLEDFLHRHLINDKIGIGDARLRVFYDVADKWDTVFLLGGQLTLPTAYTAHQQVFIGGTFDKEVAQPSFSLQEFFNLALCDPGAGLNVDKAKIVAQDFLEGVLNRLSANLVDLPLGNSDHIGLGPVFKINKKLSGPWSWQLEGYAQYQFSAYETRFFLHSKNNAEFVRDYSNENEATANLQFLSTELVNLLYPISVDTKVKPGTEISLTTQFDGSWRNWTAQFGYDFWYQSKEKICFTRESNFSYQDLQLQKGLKPRAQQSKIFGGLGYGREGKKLDWGVQLSGDWTIMSSGIGRDVTGLVSIKFYF